MKITNKKLQFLTAMAFITSSGYILSVVESAPQKTNEVAQPRTIDVGEVGSMSTQELMNSHAQAIKQSNAQKTTSATTGIDAKQTDNTLQAQQPASLDMSDSTSQNSPDAAFVTPAALVTSALSSSSSNAEAFDKLQNLSNQQDITPEQTALIKQAQILLVRAHPEVIEGLSNQLSYLPGRFISYFKEKMPTLTTDAGKQRFTQSIVMETLKSMPQSSPAMQAEFDYQLNEITQKYMKELDTISANPSNIQMITQWSRNIITEIALIAPRLIGTAVGAGLGTAGGVVSGALNGLAIGGTLGGTWGSGAGLSDATLEALDPVENESNVAYIGGKIGGAIGAIAGTPARIVGLGGVVGAATGAGVGAALGATEEGLAGAAQGAQFGYNAGEAGARYAGNALTSAARYTYNQGAKLLTPQSNLTEANVGKLPQNNSNDMSYPDTSSDSGYYSDASSDAGSFSSFESVDSTTKAPDEIRV